ncbi:MAG TPA: hypothetical protein VEI97_08080 [bacterium]|nr:hypothetical protein [bacterium]
MTFGRPTTLPEVLQALKRRVWECLEFAEEYVFVGLDLKDLEAEGGPADQFAVLTNPRAQVMAGDVTGGGADALAMDGRLELDLWARLETDEAYRDTAALEDATLGILQRWRRLLKRGTGLQLFAPLPESGGTQSLLIEPMRLVSWELRPRTPRVGWTRHVSAWEVKWLEDTTS